MKLHKLSLVLLIVLTGLLIWIPRQRRISQSREALASLRAEKAQAENNIATATEELNVVQKKLNAETELQRAVLSEAATAARALAKADPGSRWATPPDATPDWNHESPFIWIRKEMVPKFGVPMFKPSGAMEPDVASVLAIDRTTLGALNSRLKQVVADYHAVELSHAKRIEKHLPGVRADARMATVEIQPMGDVGAGFIERFKTVTQEALGMSRSDLVLQSTEGWLEDQFASATTGTKTFTVIRNANGTLSVSFKSAGSSMSAGVDSPEMISYYIPAHLLPLFGDVLNPSGTAGQK